MQTLVTLDSSILSLIILIFIYFSANNHFEKVFISNRLFLSLVKANIALIIIDILGWVFNGLPGKFNYIANVGFNLLLYISVIIAPILWILYINFQVYHDEKRLKILKRILLIPFLLNAILSVISLKTGWFFIVDANNIYHRGEDFWLHILFSYVLLIYALYFIIANKSKMEKKYYFSLLLFFLPQGVGTILQMLFYGVSFNWSGMMLSLLIVYFNIQDHSLKIDYLTGVYNRMKLDAYMKYKIRNVIDEKSFSVILIDLDNFKQINDNFGHSVGDEALKDAVNIVTKCAQSNDFIARFGGDEFLIIMDNDNNADLKAAVSKIRDAVNKFNHESKKLYKLSFCMGYDVYDSKLKMDANDFFKHIDLLMYERKKNK